MHSLEHPGFPFQLNVAFELRPPCVEFFETWDFKLITAFGTDIREVSEALIQQVRADLSASRCRKECLDP